MDQSVISPGKFGTLPEDIQARIIRRAKKTVSKRQQEITIADRIENAGTKPFTKDEAKYLMKTSRDILMFFGRDRVASIYVYSRWNR